MQETASLTIPDFERRFFPQKIAPSFFAKLVIRELADAGVVVNGPRVTDPKFHDITAFTSIALERSLGLGESYMKGQWDVGSLDGFIEKIFRSRASHRRYTPQILSRLARAIVFNLQSESRASEVCEKHYDLDNDLFERMLDRNMVYTCGYWKHAQNLEEAQLAKLDLICKKLELKPGMKVLDIGCGFGSFMKFAAENYGVECTGYSLSQRQIEWGEKNCENLPIKFVLDDYRNMEGTYDRIVSVGMMEAVGYKNFRTYMNAIHSHLADDGIALVHTVGHNLTTKITDPWIDKYIFPNGILPSIQQIGTAIEGLFVMEDWHNFGPDYDRTLMAWNENFQREWPQLKNRYSETFKRMWEFYLLSFAGGFRARSWQLWQIVLTKKGRQQPDCRIH